MEEVQADVSLILGWKDSLQEDMATHSSILAWRIPWTEEPGGLQSRGSQWVRHNLSEWACMHYEEIRDSCIGRQILYHSATENTHLPLDTVNVSCMQMGRWKCD